MRAVFYEQFQGPVDLREVADPEPGDGGVVIAVKATGLCRSDWHGWMGHDPDIRLPHVPGHEFAGVIAAVGKDVKRWQVGERVTVPFVSGCGCCGPCASGNHQVCDRQFQPGFTHWGSFAELVAIDYADTNLVALPAAMPFETAASLGCRFATAFRAVVDQGQARAGEWVVIFGCGGVGLSAIMIARALGLRVIGVDVTQAALSHARSVGAEVTLSARDEADLPETIRELTGGGAHLSIDALGRADIVWNALMALRKRARHVQIGLMVGDDARAPLPMDRIIGWELEVVGSHGMQAHRYPAMLGMIQAGCLAPEQLIGRTISLDDVPVALPAMSQWTGAGATVITLPDA